MNRLKAIRPAHGRRALFVLALSAAFASMLGAVAMGEQTQRGNVISQLRGELLPLRLPRDRLAPVALHLVGALRTDDGSLVPRVTRIELGLAGQGTLFTRGLPRCSPRQLRNTRAAEALAACGPAMVGHGRLEAEVPIPNQDPFTIRARLLAFNAHIGGRKAVVLLVTATDPPTAAVLPLSIVPGSGRFGVAMVGVLPPALGPLPRVTRFELTLSRRFRYRGAWRSYLNASCPLPPSLSAGFFSFARASYVFAGGGQLGTAITRGCRSR